MTLPEPTLRHLQRMTDDTSLFEHAMRFAAPSSAGYCTDDAGRGLASSPFGRRTWSPSLAERWLAFLVQAHIGDGRFRLRMGFDRRWTDDPSSDDACGRAIFGIGVAAAIAPWTHIGREARRLFELVAPFRSVYPRATAHAVVGAAELTVADATCVSARSLVEDGLASLPRGTDDARWPWPEPRLAYGNALLPEALIAGGHAIGDDDVVDEGLRLLRWLVAEETLGDHFSFSPAGGRGPGPDDPRPAFDQQPIEAGALAGRCARVRGHATTRGSRRSLLRRMVRRSNDVGSRCSIRKGGRLRRAGGPGVNQNQGAESTIAFVSTMQRGRCGRWIGGSASGVERGQQLSLRNHRGADAPVRRSVREVDHAVLASMCALDEHHVVDVAGALPRKLRFEQRVGELRDHATRRRVEQRDVHGVRTVPLTLVEEERGRQRSGCGARADAQRTRCRGEDRVRVQMPEAIVQYAAPPCHIASSESDAI
jgi:hypothetical protein